MTADEWAAEAYRKRRRRGCWPKKSASIIVGLAALIAILTGGRR